MWRFHKPKRPTRIPSKWKDEYKSSRGIGQDLPGFAVPLEDSDRGWYNDQVDNRQGRDRCTPCPYLSASAFQDVIIRAMRSKFKPGCRAKPDSSLCSDPSPCDLKEPTTRFRGEAKLMAASTSKKSSLEERLKTMDATLQNLKQMLQHQLDFLENLDVEVGRRLDQLEQDISLTKVGFSKELSKLHQELKNPQDEFELRVEQLEEKMAQLNREWRNDPES